MLTLSQPMCSDSLIGIVMLFWYVYKLMVLLAHVLPIKTESYKPRLISLQKSFLLL